MLSSPQWERLGHSREAGTIRIHQVCDVLIRLPERARHVRRVDIDIDGQPVSDLPGCLAHISQALLLLPNLKYLTYSNNRDDNQSDGTHGLLFHNKYPFLLTPARILCQPSPGLSEFFVSQHRITTLNHLWGHSLPNNLPHTALPNLRNVVVQNWGLAAIAHHSLHSIYLPYPMEQGSLSDVAAMLTVARIREMAVACDNSHTTLLGEASIHFPDLGYLGIHGAPKIFLNAPLPHFSNLRVLWFGNMKSQGLSTSEKVTSWSADCPSLHTVVFSDDTGTQELYFIWHKVSEGGWARASRPIFHYVMGYDEYCGCLPPSCLVCVLMFFMRTFSAISNTTRVIRATN